MTVQLEAWEHRLLAKAYGPLDSVLRQSAQPIWNRTATEDAYLRCQEITQAHSRTFYMASTLLPEAQRHAIRALYAFCRVSDDLVDEGAGDRLSELRVWQHQTSERRPTGDDPVVLAWADTRERYNIPTQYAAQLLAGVSRDLSESRYETFDELAEYCYAVASTVGLMTMHIVGYADREAIPYAVKLGVALQLTNILRDIAEDWQRGRLYLPQEELAAFGLTEDDIATYVANPKALEHGAWRWHKFMRFQIERARQLYRQALPGVMMLNRRGRFAVGAAAELYQGILDVIEENDYDVFSGRAHLTDSSKLAKLPGIWWRTTVGGYK